MIVPTGQILRTPAPVFRAVYIYPLDKMPPNLRVGEGAAIVIVPLILVDRIDSLTWLSREDIELYRDRGDPRREAS